MRLSRFFFVCSFFISGSILVGCDNPQAVHPGDTVSISYTSHFTDGSPFESSGASFVVGSGMTIAGLDEGVLGMVVGQSKTITISPEAGYGNLYTAYKIYKISLPIFNKLKSSLSGNIFHLGDISGIYKGEETDGSGNVFALIDANPRETWDSLIYKIELIKKQ